MKETLRRIISAGTVVVVLAAVSLALLPAKAQPAPPSPFSRINVITPVTPANAAPGSGGWSNSIVPQSSATAFNGQTNRTRIDMAAAPNGILSLQFRGNVTASTATTNIAFRLSCSYDARTNGFVGLATNTYPFWVWTIPTAATANPQTITAVTNVNLALVGPVPYVYVDSIWLGYCDGYLTNWTLDASLK